MKRPIMKPSNSITVSRKLSPAHVLLVHVLVILTGLPSTPLLADMLSSNLGQAGGAAGGTAASTAGATANAVNTAAATAEARANAQDMLTRNTMALQSVQAMQDAARALAATSNNLGANPNAPGQLLNVPNANDPASNSFGMIAGGLEIIGAPVGANLLTKSQENARTIVSIQQTQQQALLDWKTFNVGRETTVRFDQSAGGASAATWIAFNRVTDPTGNPTQILGSIEAQGQVYIINQNGIIFGGASQVNTGSLVASALPINDNLVARGLLNNPDSEFLFSSPDVPATVTAYGKIGNVTVQTGAKITAPTSSANVGGRVALIGPNVTNNGTISTPDGQTVLAAGMQVGFDAHSSDDPSLRGLDVYVGSVGSYGGTATNAGLIEAPRGSVVITGKNVNQNGFINSTTSAALNGRIDLLANYNARANDNFGVQGQGGAFVYDTGTSTGVVSAGAGSVLQILPEYASSLKVVGTELALKSEINMQGQAVYLGLNSVVLAPNANVTISAGLWDLLMSPGTTIVDFVHASGQVYLDQGAVINVAGSTGVAASISEYIQTVTLRGAELADSALQRNGSLRGATITVDLRKQGVRSDGTTWVGTPLANLTGYLGVIERTVGQLTTDGGTVAITAGDSVVIQDGAVVNVAGGYQDFAAGTVATTRLIDDGNLIDIADADASVVYDGIYSPGTTVTDPRWGTTTTTTGLFATNSQLEAAHSYGGSGGSLAIAAAAMALDGTMHGTTITGPQQLDSAPRRSQLSLKFQAEDLDRDLNNPIFYPTPPDIEFRQGGGSQAAAGAFSLNVSGVPLNLRQDRQDLVILAPELLSSEGFGSLLVDNPDGDILVPAQVALAATAAGSITLHAANLNIQGTLSAPGGLLELITYNISPYEVIQLRRQGDAAVHPSPDAARGQVLLGAAAVLSTAGLVINDRADAPAPFSVSHLVAREQNDGTIKYVSSTQGGSIHIHSYITQLATGSLVDVSGGLAVSNSITYGDGGAISIQSGNDPLISSLLGGHLTLGATLKGMSGSTGGALALQAPTIQVGGTAIYPNTLLLQPEFFSTGGFSQFSLTGLGVSNSPAVVITPGTVIRPIVSSLQAEVIQQNGGSSSVLLQTLTNPEGYRNAAQLTFKAPGVSNFVDNLLLVRGHIVMGQASRIETDALGTVTLKGQTLDLLGEVHAPAGAISIQGALRYPQNDIPPPDAFVTVHLGGSSRFSTTGKTVLFADPFGRRTGSVYAGGSITVAGNIIADQGAMLDVSGTSSVLDLLPQEAGVSLATLNAISQLVLGAIAVPTVIESNGGHITLNGGDFLISQATLTGRAGGVRSHGGTLAVDSGRFAPTGADDKDITMLVAQTMAAFTLPAFAPGLDIVGQALGGGLQRLGYFAADSFQNGGFDSLTLAGNLEFRGAVNLTAPGYLALANGGVIAANDLVRLTAPYVALGRPLMAPVRDEELINPFQSGFGSLPSVFSPTFGTGRLEVTADLIETGFLSLQNIGQASLSARQEMRGNGYLDIAGHLTITAGQVYPVTASTLTITAYNYAGGNGSVTLASSGLTPEFPLSGGGRLSIFASSITQGGTLRAPFGTIRLGWDGTGTAPKGLVTNANVPVAQQITLAANSVTSVSAIDPANGAGVVIPYGIVKDGTNWIDPTGLDITSTGVPDKAIRVSALDITTRTGSQLDIRGGGELYGYRWVQGNGGTTDILGSDGKFAIIPGYNAFAPVAPFATTGVNLANLGGDHGYSNDSLHVGDQIYLQASSLAAAGNYTLLPARYALLPGALLITPSAGTPVDTLVKPGGAVLASGYRFNSLNAVLPTAIYQQFEIAPQRVVKVRSEYSDYAATTFIPAAQARLSLPASRIPLDAGYALISALQSMQLAGNVAAAGLLTGRGGRVDINSPLDIVLAAPGAPAQTGKLVLNTSLLSGWNAESLLIGGVRSFGSTPVTITAGTNNLTVDNAGAPLLGTDIILAAKGNLTLAAGAEITQQGAQTAADALVVSGNGALVRVSGLAAAQTSRTGVTTSAVPALNVAAGARLSGASLTLDSSNTTSLDNSTSLVGQAINLNSGRISLLLDNPGALQTTGSLVLGGTALASLQATTALSLLSYSSIDLYGTGTFSNTGTLALRAGEIRGFNQGNGNVNLTAPSILLDNSANGAAGTASTLPGTLNVTAATITIGQNALLVNRFATVALNAASGLLLQGVGSFQTPGDLNVVTPFVSAVGNASHSLVAGGVLSLTRPSGAQTLPTSLGFGAQVSFEGSSITANTDVLLPSGLISMRARTGALSLGGRLDVGGVAKTFFDQVRYTDAGQITLGANQGNVSLTAAGTLNVAAAAGGGAAGAVVVNAASGVLTLEGTLLGAGGVGGNGGSFDLDISSLASFGTLNDKLNGGSFNQERILRLRSGSVNIDGTVNARRFLLGLDQGSITVNGTINAAGPTGGRIDLIANGNVTLNSGALLTVAATTFDNAGKGGSVTLESGVQRNGFYGAGFVAINSDSTIDLSVAAKVAGDATPANNSDFQGKFSGTLHLRAPQYNNLAPADTNPGLFNDVRVNPINGTITGASSILVEGYRIYDLTGTNGASVEITAAKRTEIRTNSETFLGVAGSASANYNAMLNRLLPVGNAGLTPLFVLAPGAEIINRTGNLTLGNASSAATNDWDLAGLRFGPKSAPGVLTFRSSGNLEFYNTLSDGFTVAATGIIVERMWLAPLSAPSTLRPLNTQSWSYRMSAGSDFSSANFRKVLSSGSLLLGKDAGLAVPSSGLNNTNTSPGTEALTRLAINPSNNTATTGTPTASNRFQVIRSGTGNIEIFTGADVRLLNQFATIYTAGAQVASGTTVFSSGDFVVPNVTQTATFAPSQPGLGAIQQLYPARYSMAGGNVTVSAQTDIIHLTRDSQGNLIDDSQRELPNNWLMRRGYVDPVTGLYGTINVVDEGTRAVTDASASTTWWINFSNFFDGIAALGGGNVSLSAGRDVKNVSAHAPTNARAARGTPSLGNLLELGGGDVQVRAGRNIDAGIYYVERGNGILQAGNMITTNATRSPSLGRLAGGGQNVVFPTATWLPTTLFVGKSSFTVSARDDVLLGPVVNTMLLPQGVNNKHWYKTYFSTYAADSSVTVSSLAGDITHRQEATIPSSSTTRSVLSLWMSSQMLPNSGSSAFSHPWLRLAETSIDPFDAFTTLMPGTLRSIAFSGDINLVGKITLSPSPTGNVELLAAGAFNGLRPTGVSSSIIPGSQTNVWASSSINLSDANPVSIPGVLQPYSYFKVAGSSNTLTRQTDSVFLQSTAAIFAESGSTTGSFASTQAKQALHAPGVLHANDGIPLRIYASIGDISGLTLFAGKASLILAERDISDISLYIQNVRESDVSVVSSGRDILAYNANSILRSQAVSNGNLTANGETPKSGDIQISGPGTLQVLTGRDLNLGTGPNNPDGTGVGITSIGNGRNPYLPFAGADVIIAAGLGGVAASLGNSQFDFGQLITDFSTPRNLTDLAELLGVSSVDLNDPALTAEQQKKLALGLFYVALRNAGRDRNDPESPDVGTYAAGYAAIDALIPSSIGTGSIQTQARDIRTKSGGDISILAPGGGLQLAATLIGDTLAPPGVITESGGNVSIFTHNDVNIGISRIFTLRGGDITIWSSIGNIAAGSSSKTVQSAPPTRVLIDPQSASIATDLAGLATGGGIGVLATVAGVRPGNVDLIAPIGAVDAGDAGIRATGNLNIAASIVLNAGNISVGGASAGTPAAPAVASPSLGGLASAASAGAAATSAATNQSEQQKQAQQTTSEELPSIISVEVIGYGGGSGEDERKRNEPGE